ncbi:hypothetical protein HJC23_005132 [Cyclotella cryptica]|uniref:Ubiquitin-like domain-containing protein n=1 Tax=Cyclotella cryptica TaxID=29204 RepID=A0ABD3QF38_9STRA
MSDDNNDVKPEGEGSEQLTIRVKDQVRSVELCLDDFVPVRIPREHRRLLLISTMEFISLAFLHQSFANGEELFFKVKRNTKMSKIFNAYATRKGVQSSAIRFLLDGERVRPDDTPKMLELEDQDQIDCVLEQSGGSL